MSLLRNILDNLSKVVANSERGSIEEIRAERDHLREEVELLKNEYETLRKSVVELIDAQEDLTVAARKLKEENVILKTAINLNGLLGGGGHVQ